MLLFRSLRGKVVSLCVINLSPPSASHNHPQILLDQAASQIRFAGTSVQELYRCQATKPQNIILPSFSSVLFSSQFKILNLPLNGCPWNALSDALIIISCEKHYMYSLGIEMNSF